MSTALRCEDIGKAFVAVPVCEETERGLRFMTHCLYPSFEPVSVYAARIGNGIDVHDGGGASRVAWSHGRDPRAINKALARQANLHHLTVIDETLIAKITSVDWLAAAIMGVANASAAAAHDVGEATQQTEASLRDMIYSVLKKIVSPSNVAQEFAVRGKSGKLHRFDFAVNDPVSGTVTVIDTVAPHHVSIASKYVAFSDTSGADSALRRGFAVHDRPLDQEDVALLTQFADVIPYSALKPGLTKRLRVH